jgi:hypothetical protein
MKMRVINACLFAVAIAASGAALARLPAPTPDEQAAAEAKKAKEKVQLEQAKALLEQAQDRVVAHYRKGTGAPTAAGGRVSDENMPKTTSELPRGVGPKPDRSPSGEAHSAPAK